MSKENRIDPVTVVGAGLAGSEAAWQLAQRDVPVRLFDMKPLHFSPAHKLPGLAELVCSNSFRSGRLENAVGLLKEEMRRLDSLIISCADQTALPAGQALAVDREQFSLQVTQKIKNHPLIELHTERLRQLPKAPAIIATGPLTDQALATSIQQELGIDELFFFDAAAPLVSSDSIDYEAAFYQSRYDYGGQDYLNCPLDEKQYDEFWQALITAETAQVHEFDKKLLFAGCLPIEEMARRGKDTIRFGPLKPVGLVDPKTGQQPYACVQLRRDNRAGSLYNLVGFQTRLTYSAQKRVFSLIPALAQADFIRYGLMHRNTYLPSPGLLLPDYSVSSRPGLYFAGQITGVEGYVESAASGLLAGWQAALWAKGIEQEQRLASLPSAGTVIGALAAYISDARVKHFQPMNANFGLLDEPTIKIKQKKAKIDYYIERSLAEIDSQSGKTSV